MRRTGRPTRRPGSQGEGGGLSLEEARLLDAEGGRPGEETRRLEVEERELGEETRLLEVEER